MSMGFGIQKDLKKIRNKEGRGDEKVSIKWLHAPVLENGKSLTGMHCISY